MTSPRRRLKTSGLGWLVPYYIHWLMKTLLFLLFMAGLSSQTRAQQPLNYTVWVDGLVNPQLAKSAFYFLGTGVRAEISRPIGTRARAWFAQVGYGHFFQKPTSAFVANIGLVNVGYRYQSRRAFTASVGVGVQYWQERLRLHFVDDALDETLTSLIPAVTVGLGLRIKSRYRVGLENRVLLKPEPASLVLRNNLALSIGYTLSFNRHDIR